MIPGRYRIRTDATVRRRQVNGEASGRYDTFAVMVGGGLAHVPLDVRGGGHRVGVGVGAVRVDGRLAHLRRVRTRLRGEVLPEVGVGEIGRPAGGRGDVAGAGGQRSRRRVLRVVGVGVGRGRAAAAGVRLRVRHGGEYVAAVHGGAGLEAFGGDQLDGCARRLLQVAADDGRGGGGGAVDGAAAVLRRLDELLFDGGRRVVVVVVHHIDDQLGAAAARRDQHHLGPAFV